MVAVTGSALAQGNSVLGTWKLNLAKSHYDGKDYTYSGSASRDTIALTRIDAATVESALKRSGRIMPTNRTVISDGGKVMTQTSVDGMGPNGQRAV